MSNVFLSSLDDVVKRTSREGYEKIYNTTYERKCQIYFCEGQALALRYGGTDVPQIVVRGPGTAMPWPVGQDRLILTCSGSGDPELQRQRTVAPELPWRVAWRGTGPRPTVRATGCRLRAPALDPFGNVWHVCQNFRRSRTTDGCGITSELTSYPLR